MNKQDLDKASYSLLSKYSSLYKEKYNSAPIVNKHKEKWAMKSLIEDFGVLDVTKVLEYYFSHLDKDKHPLSWFYNNFDTILKRKMDAEKDEMFRMQRRIEMEKIRQEYLNGNA